MDVMPFFKARRPVRRGVLWAFRSSAAVDVLVRASRAGWCAKRSGLGVKVDFMVRIDVYAMAGLDKICCAFCWRRDRADEGRRKDGGRSPQLRGALGGIVDVVLLRW
jgi:hypothetical protein